MNIEDLLWHINYAIENDDLDTKAPISVYLRTKNFSGHCGYTDTSVYIRQGVNCDNEPYVELHFGE